MYKDERQVAKIAEDMLESALKSKVSGFKAHYYRDKEQEEKALKNLKTKSKVKKYGLVKNGTAQYYMRSLSVKMDKHGFVQHYGVDTLREGGIRKREKPKPTEYSFKTHYFNMKAQPFIDGAIQSSGVVDFVMRNITAIRAEELMVSVKRYMEA